MTPERLTAIEEIFHSALDCEPDQLNAFLEKRCAGDEALRCKVEALLASHQHAGSFIETPIAALATSIVENDQADLLVGQTIGHYKISKRIGSGGMGEVYLASDITAGRKAALKLLPTRFTGDAERLKRFQQEARAVVGLNHPNVLTVYEIGAEDSTHYIASELIEGETLRQRLTRRRLQLSEAIEISIQVASALAAAHEAGIVHRDIKPENIMLRPDGYVKVLDFGIAKLAEQEVPVTMAEKEALLLVETNLGSILGTVRYMSPEQARGAPVDKLTDIWSLGAVFYEMAAGRAPFTGQTPREVMAAILAMEPPPPGRYIAQAPVELQQIVSKALRKAPDDRYQNANEMLDALKSLRRKLEFRAELERSAATGLWLRWRRSPTALVLTLLAGALALALPFYWLRNRAVNAMPEKSIAVLPFQNLNKEQENAFFADGVQDEILSSLAKVADLKVISRTSVMQYKNSAKRNLREIGQQLGVANVVEGSVQHIGNRVRVNAQLINARNDAHLWAQTYDGDLQDVFAIQSQIARTIADQLQAKISAGEKAAIAQPPTTDLKANALYRQALDLEFKPPGERENLPRAVQLLAEAVARDPQFALAYCAMSRMHMILYFGGFDHTPARRELANVALQKAARIQPDAGEVHLAAARYWFHGFFDYDRARAELELARRSLPNDPKVYAMAAAMDRRQGRWSEAVRNFERAVELDPRDMESIMNTAFTYEGLHRYSDATRMYVRAAAIPFDDYLPRIAARSFQALNERADIRPLRAELNAILAEDPNATAKIADPLWFCAILERNRAAIERALAAIPSEGLYAAGNFVRPREWCVGYAARMFGDAETARTAFTAARSKLEKIVQEQPDYAAAWSLLGRVDAALGRKEEAIRAGRRACELLPLSKDAWFGPGYIQSLAKIYAWTGEKELALSQLEQLAAQKVGSIDYGDLKLDPDWDPLRGDPRFEALVARMSPGTKSAPPMAIAIPEKSIAVLPFENLSDDKANSYFAAGIQDEILSNLAKVADLKVTSRTSANLYKSDKPRNSREIGQQLGVAHLLEGNVQRAGNRMRINAQLIDARTDTHVWSQTYDRDLTDVFTIQSEVAHKVADVLQAKLTGREQQAAGKKPTENLDAYDAYLRGIVLEAQAGESLETFPRLVELYTKAVKLDPKFAQAWARLSIRHIYSYSLFDHTPKRLAEAKEAVDTALRLQPDLGEAYQALGYYYYLGLHDFEAALHAYEQARQRLPNNAALTLLIGEVKRRQGKWDEAVALQEHAAQLDPLNTQMWSDLGLSYLSLRNFAEARRAFDRGLAISPDNTFLIALKVTSFQGEGDLDSARKLLERVPFTPGDSIYGAHFAQWCFDRNYHAGIEALRRVLERPESLDPMVITWCRNALGLLEHLAGDEDAAKADFKRSLDQLNRLRDQGNDGFRIYSRFAWCYAGLGEKEAAVKAAQHAVDLAGNDAIVRPPCEFELACIQARVGESEQAIATLARLLKTPGGATHGELRFEPNFDPLRENPLFKELLEEK